MTTIGELYAFGTIASFITLALLSGSVVFALFFCGWIGLFVAIFVNEMTPGHTMKQYGGR